MKAYLEDSLEEMVKGPGKSDVCLREQFVANWRFFVRSYSLQLNYTKDRFEIWAKLDFSATDCVLRREKHGTSSVCVASLFNKQSAMFLQFIEVEFANIVLRVPL